MKFCVHYQLPLCLNMFLTMHYNLLVNPLSTTGLLTPFQIGPYLEMFTWVANYDKALKMLHTQTCIWDHFFLTTSLIGSINDRIFILTNQQVVLMGFKCISALNQAGHIWLDSIHKLCISMHGDCVVLISTWFKADTDLIQKHEVLGLGARCICLC